MSIRVLIFNRKIIVVLRKSDQLSRLRKWLKKKKLTIIYFAALVRVDRRYIHMLMKGTKIPSDSLMRRIRRLTLDDVFTTKDMIDPKPRRKNESIKKNTYTNTEKK